LRTFIAIVHVIVAISWKRSGKENIGQTQFNTKFATKLSLMSPKKNVDCKKRNTKEKKIYIIYTYKPWLVRTDL
jgi:hypothetical protein